MKCGNCLYTCGKQCHHVTGQCLQGCLDGYHGSRCDQAFELRSSENETKWQSSIALYVCVAIIILSVSLNVFLIIRLRGSIFCTQTNQGNPDNQFTAVDKGPQHAQSSPKQASNPNVDDDSTAYQELGELNKESDYDKLH